MYGNRYEFRDGTPTADGVLLLDELAIVVVIVLTLTHRYNAVRGHRTGSNNSGGKSNENRR